MLDSIIRREQYILASSARAPADLLRAFALNSHSRIRQQVAENPRTDLQTLANLLTDPDPLVRAGLAYNRALPPAFLQQLAEDENADIRYELAENAHLPVALLEKLSDDENPYVAHRATKTLARLQISAGDTGIAA